jgi:curli production assembly/transport component CsgG
MLTVLVSGCSFRKNLRVNSAPALVKNQLQTEFDSVPSPVDGPVVVAVYSFTDKTGQRKSSGNSQMASFSSAVTQGAEVYLIQALQNVGQGRWFRVVERVGLDNISRERQLIRQMREAYEGPNAKPISPMMFAGVIVEGGIIGYDSATHSGGLGAKLFGIGPMTQYSQDTVYISLRVVSVQTGEVLLTVNTQKTIFSYGAQVASLKFINGNLDALEAEIGYVVNEPVTFAVKTATESAVLELINQGVKQKLWQYQNPPTTPAVTAAPTTSAVKNRKTYWF